MLSASDYHFLAEVTDQYSPCDITNIVSAAKNERWSRTKRAKYFKQCPRIESNPDIEGKYMPCRKEEEGATRITAEEIEELGGNIFLPPLTMKDLERGTWIAKRTGDPKDLPKLKEFANTIGQTIHEEDEADSEDGSESEPESDSEEESEPESETDEG
jgi:hypothetical protein